MVCLRPNDFTGSFAVVHRDSSQHPPSQMRKLITAIFFFMFCPSETAAKFSTAAAASLSASRVAAKLAHPATTYDPTAMIIDSSTPPATDPALDPNDNPDEDMADPAGSGDLDHNPSLDLTRTESGSIGGSRRVSLAGSKRASLDSGFDNGGEENHHGNANHHPSPRDGLAFGSPTVGSRNGGASGSNAGTPAQLLGGKTSSFLSSGGSGSMRSSGSHQPQRASLAADPAPLATTLEDAVVDDSIADMLHDAPYDPESYNLDSIYDPEVEETGEDASAPSQSASLFDRTPSDASNVNTTSAAAVQFVHAHHKSAHRAEPVEGVDGEPGGGLSSSAAEVLDMAPIIARPDEAPSGIRLAVPGDRVSCALTFGLCSWVSLDGLGRCGTEVITELK